jgi:hypothetical protein
MLRRAQGSQLSEAVLWRRLAAANEVVVAGYAMPRVVRGRDAMPRDRVVDGAFAMRDVGKHRSGEGGGDQGGEQQAGHENTPVSGQ